MVKWTIVSTNIINRIGYNRLKKSMYIDFVGSEIDTIFSKVPEELYSTFIQAKYPDQFYVQFVEFYFEIVIEELLDFKQYPEVVFLDHYRTNKANK